MFSHGDDTYVGRTCDIDRRIREHVHVYGKIHLRVLGKYNTKYMRGIGNLQPRMEYLWYTRLHPTLNRVTPGKLYFERDCKKFDNPIEKYEELEIVTKSCCA